MSVRDEPLICFPFIGDFVGGSHISALGLIRRLGDSSCKLLVVLHRPEGPLAQLLRSEGVPFEAAPVADHPELGSPRGGVGLIRAARAVPKLSGFLRNRGVKIVHTNDGRIHVIWGLAARLAGVRTLWHHRSDPTAFGLRYVAPLVADRVAAVSRFASPQPGWFSAAARCSVIHSPFDVESAAKVERDVCRARLVAELGCAADTLLLGYFGALIHRKRPLLFVETVAALRKLAPDVNVMGVLFGEAFEGLDIAVKARAQELGVADEVRLMGFRYPGEIWLAAVDQLLVTAVDEPFGRTLIEAMLLGTPVIAAASGGNLEAIEEARTGLLVAPDDPQAFARAAIALSRDPQRAQSIADAARADARLRFGIDRHVEAVMRLYADMLGQQATPESTAVA